MDRLADRLRGRWTGWQLGRLAGCRLAGRQEGRHPCWQAGRLVVRQTGRLAGRQVDRQAGLKDGRMMMVDTRTREMKTCNSSRIFAHNIRSRTLLKNSNFNRWSNSKLKKG